MKSMFVGVGLVLGATSLGLMSCGGDTAAPPTTAVNIGATNFVTIPPVPVTIAPATIPVDVPGSILEFESSYTLTADDYPSTVAAKFKVVFQEFMDLNGFELVGNQVPLWPGVGGVVKIPAGATVPGEPVTTVAPTAATLPGATTAPTTATTTAPTTPAPPTTLTGACAPGSYVILEGDYTGKVALKFDVTVAALDAANANTKYYKSFAVGVKIVIPAPSDC